MNSAIMLPHASTRELFLEVRTAAPVVGARIERR